MIFQKYKIGNLAVYKDSVRRGIRNPRSFTDEETKSMTPREFIKDKATKIIWKNLQNGEYSL